MGQCPHATSRWRPAPPQPRSDTWVDDAEREQADLRLQRAVGDGTLSLFDYDRRVQAVWQARTLQELADPLRGLPDVAAPEAQGAPGSGDALISRPVSRAAAALGAGTLAAALVAALVVGLPSSTGAPDPSAPNIVVTPGQSLVELGNLVGSVTIVVPPTMRADVSALRGTGVVHCPNACAADAVGSVVRIEGRYTGEVSITYQ